MTDHVTINDRVFKDNALPNRLAELLFEVCDEQGVMLGGTISLFLKVFAITSFEIS